ncbi:hypothetical protein NIES39_K04740 [Arthrospira platensis NIES-39]|nr:hypothetical protein NIES39_K04740 [Arthrospira platensis NIES-39]
MADRAPAPTGNFIPKNKKKIILAPPRHFFLGNPCFWAALLLVYYIMGYLQFF